MAWYVEYAFPGSAAASTEHATENEAMRRACEFLQAGADSVEVGQNNGGVRFRKRDTNSVRDYCRQHSN